MPPATTTPATTTPGAPVATATNPVFNQRVKANGMKGPNIRFFSIIGPYITIGCFLLLTIINMNIKLENIFEHRFTRRE